MKLERVLLISALVPACAALLACDNTDTGSGSGQGDGGSVAKGGAASDVKSGGTTGTGVSTTGPGRSAVGGASSEGRSAAGKDTGAGGSTAKSGGASGGSSSGTTGPGGSTTLGRSVTSGASSEGNSAGGRDTGSSGSIGFVAEGEAASGRKSSGATSTGVSTAGAGGAGTGDDGSSAMGGSVANGGAANGGAASGGGATPSDGAGTSVPDPGNSAKTQAAGGAPANAGAKDEQGTDAGEAGDNPGQVVDSGANTSPVDYGARGPYEVTVEKNVGESFRNNVADDTEQCKQIMGALLGGTDSEGLESLTTYPADMDRGLYTLFRPAELEEGKQYPVITWANGTCSQPFIFSKLIEHLASHGFLVIASNSRQTGTGEVVLRAIDFMLSEAENAESPWYGKIDTEMLGACGHSQGSTATIAVGADERVVATVPIQGASAAGVAALKGPTFLIAGELDTTVAPAGIESAFNAAQVPAVYGLSMGQDHKMPPVSPAPILGAVTAWFKIHLANDQNARDMFYGDACTLCNDPAWTIKRKNL
ncbi:hypothetical protein ACFL5O_09090 [Myxococcota bacterium]